MEEEYIFNLLVCANKKKKTKKRKKVKKINNKLVTMATFLQSGIGTLQNGKDTFHRVMFCNCWFFEPLDIVCIHNVK